MPDFPSNKYLKENQDKKIPYTATKLLIIKDKKILQMSSDLYVLYSLQ